MAIVEYELFSEDGHRVVVSGDADEPEDIEVELYSPDLLPGLSRVVERMAVGTFYDKVCKRDCLSTSQHPHDSPAMPKCRHGQSIRQPWLETTERSDTSVVEPLLTWPAACTEEAPRNAAW